MSRWTSLLTAAVGAAAARGAWTTLTASPPGGAQRWTRTNHRGEPLTLLQGPAVALAAAAAAATAPGLPPRLRAAGSVAALGAGAFGVLDDLAEKGTSKGLRGHLGALARGEVTTGGVKIAGIGAVGLVAGALAARQRGERSVGDALVAGALVAGTANLVNLLDLRPGRATKFGLLAAPALLAGGPAGGLVAAAGGASAALLPEDLGERSMLGDGGANAIGALLGTAAVAGTSRPVRLALLGGVVALTLASEKVSFTKVIASTPGLREFDALGRRPAPDPARSPS